MGLGERLAAVALPVATLALVVIAHMMRMTRNAVLVVMSTPYIEMAFLKGCPRSRIVSRHALPNALAPIIYGRGAQPRLSRRRRRGGRERVRLSRRRAR